MRTFLKVSLLTSVLAGPLGAEELDDIFAEGAFDSAVAAGQASEEANKLVWLGGVTLASSANLVLPTERASYGSLSQFTGKGFLKATKPEVGALFLSYSYAQTLWASTNDALFQAGYAKQALDPSDPVYSLSEWHLSFDVGKTVFLRVGNQLLDWGASAVWSPADFINRRSADPNAALDTRAGKPGIRVHVPWAAGNVFLFADASSSLSNTGEPRDLVKTGTLGLKVDTTLAGWNLGLIGNVGQAAPPRAGLTASGAFLGVDLWGEAGAVLPWGDHKFSWSASLGGERSLGVDSEWTLRAEGFWNPEGQGDVALGPSTVTSFTPFYWGRAYLYGEVVRQKLFSPDVGASLSGTTNLADQSWSATASLRTSLPGLLPFSLFAQYAGGQKDREFTWATGGPALTLGLRSVVEF